MPSRFLTLLAKELMQFFRDKVMLILILWLYTVEAVMCTMALSFDVKQLATAFVDYDQSATSRLLKERFLVADEFRLVGTPASEAEAASWLQSGKAVLVVVVPQDFGRNLMRGDVPTVQMLLDASNSNTAAIARGYALQVVSEFEQDWANHEKRETTGTALPIMRVWYNPDLTFTSFMVLSMIGLAAMMVGVIHSASSIVREKEVGTIEQLLVTPISTAELFAAKTFPTLFMGVLAIFPSLLIVAMFDVPLRGSLGFFLGMTALFLLSAISLGVLIASVTKTLQQALLLSFFGLFPILFLSGTLVPIESMPEVLQKLSFLSPLRYYMDIILGVFLKGAGPSELWPQAVALLGIGFSLFALSAAVFKRT